MQPNVYKLNNVLNFQTQTRGFGRKTPTELVMK